MVCTHAPNALSPWQVGTRDFAHRMMPCAFRWQFSSLSGGGGAASMAQLMSIVNHQKAVSAKLDGCSGVCVVGATAGLSVRFPRAPRAWARAQAVSALAELTAVGPCTCRQTRTRLGTGPNPIRLRTIVWRMAKTCCSEPEPGPHTHSIFFSASCRRQAMAAAWSCRPLARG